MNLRKTLFILPNLFTLSSIFCGFYAILICTSNPSADDHHRAALLIIFAMFFDTIDGRVARLTRTQSAFGVQIDSLADVVSFGIATAVLVYSWALSDLGFGGIAVCFAFAACGAIRLARFNVLTTDPRGTPQKPGKYIVGLPIPTAAGVLISLVVANHAVGGRLMALKPVIVGVTLVLSALMVSTIKFRSFKDLKLRNPRTIAFIVIVVGSSIAISLVYHPTFALVWLLGCYVLIGMIETVIALGRRAARRGGQSVPPPPPEPPKP
ncbi:MAG: CDP-diacylglycerol--serine O-phosphatidyltransferase [Deltaproteobacteria bacterium]|nr:CDP-diacylglycerol--serine O-phosphatidyltransferase [Deltaproteobacteria bacterium]